MEAAGRGTGGNSAGLALLAPHHKVVVSHRFRERKDDKEPFGLFR